MATAPFRPLRQSSRAELRLSTKLGQIQIQLLPEVPTGGAARQGAQGVTRRRLKVIYAIMRDMVPYAA